MENVWMMGFASGIAHLVHFGLMVTLIIVAAVVVRRHRPDAWMGFLIAGVVEIIGSGIHTLLTSIGPTVITTRGGPMAANEFSTFFAATTLLATCVNVAFWVLMILGVVKLAKPVAA